MQRNSAAFVILLTVALGTIRAGEFEDANQLYDQGKFGEARQLYERLVERGEWSADLFYNLGNADYRIGAPGLAMLNYERALALDGTHAEARANLKWLRDQNGARVPVRRWWDYALPPFSGDAFAILAALGAWGAVFGATAALFGRRPWGWVTLAVLLTIYSAGGVWRRDQDRELAVITAKEAVARLAPADRASLAEALPAGSRVRVFSERGEWIYCGLPGGGLGWISHTQLERICLERS